MFGPATKVVDCAGDFPRPGINCSDALATAVRGENAVGLWGIDNPVGVVAHPNFVQHGKGFEIEHRDRAWVCGTDEPVTKFPRDSNTVHAILARNFSDDSGGIQVE